VIVSEVIDEVAHYASDDYAGDELCCSYAMKHPSDFLIARRRCSRTIEEHPVACGLFFAGSCRDK